MIFQPAVLTQAEIRDNYKKIILGRWKQWQDHLMLICMFQVRLKISNSCRCFYRCRNAVPDFRTSIGECIFLTICFWFRQCQIGSRLSCVMAPDCLVQCQIDSRLSCVITYYVSKTWQNGCRQRKKVVSREKIR